MKKKTKFLLAAGLAAVVLAAGGYWFFNQSSGSQEQTVDKNATVRTNYYQAVNKDWLEKTEIPSDRPDIDAASELSEEVKKKMQADVKNLASGKESSDITGMSEFIKFYKLATDFDQREKVGVEPVKPYLKEIEDLKDLKDLAVKANDWQLRGLPLPFGYGVGEDLENTSQKQMQLASPGIFLPDVSYYEDEASKKAMLEPLEEASKKALKLLGYSDKDSQRIVKEAVEFDQILSSYAQSSEEAADIKSQYNPKSPDQVNAYSETFKFYDLIKSYIGQDVDNVNVVNTKFYDNFSKIVNDENFAKIKSWMLFKQASSVSGLLTDEYRLIYAEVNKAWNGIAEATSKEDAAYNQSVGTFSDVLSVYYGRKYFGEEAKRQVTQMVDDIKSVYRERLEKNDWLSEDTKKEAIKKLDTMTLFIGYPEDVTEATKAVKVDENQTLFDNVQRLSRETEQTSIDQFNEPVDKTEWIAPSYEVNAYYAPTNNSINFPAGILQAPFYDAKQSLEENYGGIGVVIGHEITHAFDSNGADFDENGNMKNWWTEADTKAFEEKTQAIIKQWDGIEIYGGKVNGKLTVTENVADAGGISSTLEVLKKKDAKADLKAYFENYAVTWRTKASQEYYQMLLNVDVHAPAELRVNQQVKNFQEFYNTYPEIKEGDPMYLTPDKRVSLW